MCIRADWIYFSKLRNIFEFREAAEKEIVSTSIYKNPYVHDKDVYSVSLYSFCWFFFFLRQELSQQRAYATAQQ